MIGMPHGVTRDAILAGPEFAVVVLHVVVLGGWVVRRLGFAVADRWTWAAVVPAVGFAVFGGELFVLGEARVLTRAAVYASTAGVAWLGLRGRPLAGFPGRVRADPPQGRRRWALIAVIVITAAVVLPACFHPPRREDEVQYHWPTPLLWAGAHGWVASPYRLSNGPALAEMLYTVAALFGNPTVAHLTHAAFLVILVAGCGALARAVGGSALAAATAATSIPTLVADAPYALNDNVVAGFAVAAYVCLLGGPLLVPSTAAVTLAGVLVVAAVSTKPFALLVVPGMVAFLLVRAAGAADVVTRRRMAWAAAVLSAAVVAALGVWSLHCFLRTGRWWETNGVYLATSPADPLWDSPMAAGRHPRLIDRLTTPIVLPLATSIGPETGQYGNRIGPLVVVFGLLAIPGRRLLGGDGRRKLVWLAGSAGFFLVAFAPTSPKTRFHLFVWSAAAVAAGVGYLWTQRLGGRRPLGATALFVVLALVGPADGVRHIFHVGTGLLRGHPTLAATAAVP